MNYSLYNTVTFVLCLIIMSRIPKRDAIHLCRCLLLVSRWSVSVYHYQHTFVTYSNLKMPRNPFVFQHACMFTARGPFQSSSLFGFLTAINSPRCTHSRSFSVCRLRVVTYMLCLLVIRELIFFYSLSFW